MDWRIILLVSAAIAKAVGQQQYQNYQHEIFPPYPHSNKDTNQMQLSNEGASGQYGAVGAHDNQTTVGQTVTNYQQMPLQHSPVTNIGISQIDRHHSSSKKSYAGLPEGLYTGAHITSGQNIIAYINKEFQYIVKKNNQSQHYGYQRQYPTRYPQRSPNFQGQNVDQHQGVIGYIQNQHVYGYQTMNGNRHDPSIIVNQPAGVNPNINTHQTTDGNYYHQNMHGYQQYHGNYHASNANVYQGVRRPYGQSIDDHQPNYQNWNGHQSTATGGHPHNRHFNGYQVTGGHPSGHNINSYPQVMGNTQPANGNSRDQYINVYPPLVGNPYGAQTGYPANTYNNQQLDRNNQYIINNNDQNINGYQPMWNTNQQQINPSSGVNFHHQYSALQPGSRDTPGLHNEQQPMTNNNGDFPAQDGKSKHQDSSQNVDVGNAFTSHAAAVESDKQTDRKDVDETSIVVTQYVEKHTVSVEKKVKTYSVVGEKNPEYEKSVMDVFGEAVDSSETSDESSEEKVTNCTMDDGKAGECTLFFNCIDGHVLTNGTGVLAARHGLSEEYEGNCPDEMVCCIHSVESTTKTDTSKPSEQSPGTDKDISSFEQQSIPEQSDIIDVPPHSHEPKTSGELVTGSHGGSQNTLDHTKVELATQISGEKGLNNETKIPAESVTASQEGSQDILDHSKVNQTIQIGGGKGLNSELKVPEESVPASQGGTQNILDHTKVKETSQVGGAGGSEGPRSKPDQTEEDKYEYPGIYVQSKPGQGGNNYTFIQEINGKTYEVTETYHQSINSTTYFVTKLMKEIAKETPIIHQNEHKLNIKQELNIEHELEPSKKGADVDLSLYNCGKKKMGMLGSESAETGEFPWTVALFDTRYNKEQWNGYFGGGSLIHPLVVLTGARQAVLVADRVTDLVIWAGTIDVARWNPNGQKRAASKIIIHQEFDPETMFNNLALVLVADPFQLNDNVGVACLPPLIPIPRITSTCLASGWETEKDSTSIMKKVKMPAVERQRCLKLLHRTRLGSRFDLDRSFMCAGGIRGLDLCTGSGGSPLSCPFIAEDGQEVYAVSGVVSWGVACGVSRVPAIFADVAYLREWLDRAMEELDLMAVDTRFLTN